MAEPKRTNAAPTDARRRYNSLSAWLTETFGCRVYKVTIDAGFTCPHRGGDGDEASTGCTYCLPDSIRPVAYDARSLSIADQLAAGMERLRNRYNAEKFVAYFQVNTSTFAPLAELKRLYSEAASHPDVVALAVSTRPDSAGDEVLDAIVEAAGGKRVWVELGLQSANDATLERIGRGHTAAAFVDAVRRARARSIDVCAHVMVGLPGEGREELMRTIDMVSDSGAWGIKFHQLQVLKGTPLEAEFLEGSIPVLGLEEYSALVVESIERLAPDVIVHRLSGDAPPRYLVAPRWGVDKSTVVSTIELQLEQRGSRQGSARRK